VRKTFKNLNSFEMMLKMIKKMQIYLKNIFFYFRCFSLFLNFKKEIYKKRVKNWVATKIMQGIGIRPSITSIFI